VANATERIRRVARCRVCHLPSGVDRRLIAGPGVHICESCLETLPGRKPAVDAAQRCSFCRRRDVPIAGAYPSLAICAACLELARGVLAEEDRRSRPAT
jgi:hypothetical protein